MRADNNLARVSAKNNGEAASLLESFIAPLKEKSVKELPEIVPDSSQQDDQNKPAQKEPPKSDRSHSHDKVSISKFMKKYQNTKAFKEDIMTEKETKLFNYFKVSLCY